MSIVSTRLSSQAGVALRTSFGRAKRGGEISARRPSFELAPSQPFPLPATQATNFRLTHFHAALQQHTVQPGKTPLHLATGADERQYKQWNTCGLPKLDRKRRHVCINRPMNCPLHLSRGIQHPIVPHKVSMPMTINVTTCT